MYTKLIEHEMGSMNPCMFGDCAPVGHIPIAKNPDDDDENVASMHENLEKPQFQRIPSVS
jgi:hypothetical protein